MNIIESTITIGVVIIGTLITRFLPFILFPSNKNTPKYIEYLGTVLPFATTGMIIIYCLKDTSFKQSTDLISKIISILFIIIIHKLKSNMLYSIIGGTICYMILIQ